MPDACPPRSPPPTGRPLVRRTPSSAFGDRGTAGSLAAPLAGVERGRPRLDRGDALVLVVRVLGHLREARERGSLRHRTAPYTLQRGNPGVALWELPHRHVKGLLQVSLRLLGFLDKGPLHRQLERGWGAAGGSERRWHHHCLQRLHASGVLQRRGVDAHFDPKVSKDLVWNAGGPKLKVPNCGTSAANIHSLQSCLQRHPATRRRAT
mmetsp:Transcript_27208/g.74848  ORF Transcript_27208/g.74848 Transcript_27208/m.74848 type:complete len:208 (-) Transcript_27208:396-1019(-)